MFDRRLAVGTPSGNSSSSSSSSSGSGRINRVGAALAVARGDDHIAVAECKDGDDKDRGVVVGRCVQCGAAWDEYDTRYVFEVIKE